MPEAAARLPVLALVGRPNVGKSTLFNRLTRSRSALVASIPGLTRDRHYGRGRMGERPFVVIDTGGFEPVARDGLAFQMARQARLAILEADVVLLVVDGREGLHPRDSEIVDELRRTAAVVGLAVNKTEGMPQAQAMAEFHRLGVRQMFAISAAHGDGVRAMLETLLPAGPDHASAGADHAIPDHDNAGADRAIPDHASAGLDEVSTGTDDPGARAAAAAQGAACSEAAAQADAARAAEGPVRVKVAIVGRPNAGKSTLINALLGEERAIAFDQPGTTRDALSTDCTFAGRPYALIDTAGLRRRAKVSETVEKFSVVKTLQAIEDSHVCVLLLDAHEGIGHLDGGIANYILDAGRAVVLAVNKWDALKAEERAQVKQVLDRELQFLRFARLCFISAREERGLKALMQAVDKAYASATARLSTPRLTRALREAVEHQQPPRAGRFRPKMRYAHQGGRNPPVVVIHGNSLEKVPASYARYLEGCFRTVFKLEGTPLRIEWRSAANPYVKEASA